MQAQAIVDMRLRTLVGLERKKIEDEYAELIKTIAELQDILRSPRRIAQIVKSETLDVKKRFGDERRTAIEAAEDEISMEQLIPNIEVVVTYTVGGYIKRVRSTRSARRIAAAAASSASRISSAKTSCATSS